MAPSSYLLSESQKSPRHVSFVLGGPASSPPSETPPSSPHSPHSYSSWDEGVNRVHRRRARSREISTFSSPCPPSTPRKRLSEGAELELINSYLSEETASINQTPSLPIPPFCTPEEAKSIEFFDFGFDSNKKSSIASSVIREEDSENDVEKESLIQRHRNFACADLPRLQSARNSTQSYTSSTAFNASSTVERNSAPDVLSSEFERRNITKIQSTWPSATPAHVSREGPYLSAIEMAQCPSLSSSRPPSSGIDTSVSETPTLNIRPFGPPPSIHCRGSSRAGSPTHSIARKPVGLRVRPATSPEPSRSEATLVSHGTPTERLFPAHRNSNSLQQNMSFFEDDDEKTRLVDYLKWRRHSRKASDGFGSSAVERRQEKGWKHGRGGKWAARIARRLSCGCTS
ncbi:hypothetical protein BDY21DRAFT_336180 [Lineolata rhizophorae]|uniref:Uncharacterized protein n=1 Tax=Lineolata rhizophorae TaxID=578093 RepID=A0A6A6P9Z8_9PEZI|nr:hypothetical protein BDY21DRAFT_336180 [Lineolata rhizophorae]